MSYAVKKNNKVVGIFDTLPQAQAFAVLEPDFEAVEKNIKDDLDVGYYMDENDNPHRYEPPKEESE